MAGGAAKLKVPPAGNERERGDIRERCQHQRSTMVGGLERPVWKAARPETSLPQARTSFP